MIKTERMPRLHAGFTLIEILITVFILALGLLGFAALQTEGLKNNKVAEDRTQITQLNYNIADRIRANLSGAFNGAYVAAAAPAVAYDCETSFTGTVVANKCSATEMANADLDRWYGILNNILPSGAGTISCVDADPADADACTKGSLYTITTAWQESTRLGFAAKTLSLDIQP